MYNRKKFCCPGILKIKDHKLIIYNEILIIYDSNNVIICKRMIGMNYY